MASIVKMSPAVIAINRFGLGVSLDSSHVDEAAAAYPKKWLLAQLDQYQPAPASLESQTKTAILLEEYAKKQQDMRNVDADTQKATKRMFRLEIKNDYQEAVRARAQTALLTPTPFIERLVYFWANHFAISTEKPAVADFAGAFELEAIRPHVLGSFKDLLFAVEQHPAMLLYLDQEKSIGPQSMAASRAAERHPEKRRGLNENLAREIMELHTLGVRSGYTQTDVTEFARALTGWNIASIGNGPVQNNNVVQTNGFMFRPQLHEPGSRNIMGKNYSQTGQAQAEAILTDLASAPATATHIATKLARHFVSDTPPASLVDKLARTFMSSNGKLSSLYRVLIDATESWDSAPAKFKTPWEWMISALRGLGRKNLDGINIAQIMNQLGQPVWRPGSPAGYDDIADTWASPNALLRRVEVAQRLAASSGDKLDARTLGEKLLINAISPQTQAAVTRSESATTGLALLLVSPEFLRR